MIALHEDVVISIVTAFAMVIAASLPALVSYRAAKRSWEDITSIKEQILPGNGQKIHEYLSEAKDQLTELKADVRQVSFDLQRHQYTYHHDRRLTEE